MKRKIKTNKSILILIIVLVIILILCLVAFKIITKKDATVEYEKAVLKREETIKELVVEDLSGKTEQQRMEYYCSQFFKYVSTRNFEKAYDLLYSEYKENYFPTIESFERYMIDYFPSDVSITYTNFERLGNIYVLWIRIKDVYNGTNGHNFDMNVVIREDAYNDIKMSFSRNSAVEGMEE